jgi:rubredoxin
VSLAKIHDSYTTSRDTILTASASIVRTAVETLKTAYTARGQIASDKKVIDAFEQLGKIQDTLFELRHSLAALQDENHELKTKVREQNEWSAKAARYALTQSSGPNLAILCISDPQHWACPVCFEKKQIMVLQPWDPEMGSYHCPDCKLMLNLDEPKPRPPSRPSRSPYG